MTKRFMPDGTFYIDRDGEEVWRSRALGVARSFGYLYDHELLLFQAIIKSLPQGAKVVNIGAGSGTSGLAIVEARPDLAKTAWTIDISEGGTPFGGLLNERNAFAEHGKDLPMINQILGDSSEVGKNWNKGDIDFIFVDGNHSELGVELDINAWRPHVKNHGWMLYHDFNHGFWPMVKPTVERLMCNDIRVAVVDITAAYMVMK